MFDKYNAAIRARESQYIAEIEKLQRQNAILVKALEVILAVGEYVNDDAEAAEYAYKIAKTALEEVKGE